MVTASETPICPVCTSPGEFVLKEGDRFYQVTDEVVALYRCSRHGCHFQWPLPGKEAVAGFYPSGYWQEDDRQGLMARLQGSYIKFMLDRDLMWWINRLNLSEQARLLDVGCSRGDWLARIRERGYRVSGLEGDPRAAAYARDRHGLDVEQTNAEDWTPLPSAFEAITFFHLLEHLREPRQFLRNCRKALKKEGKLLLRVPNIASWQARISGKFWKGLELPRHLVLFTPASLEFLLEREGFAIEVLSTWSLRDGPPAMSSTLFPYGEPTRQMILGRPRPFATLFYLALTWGFAPLEGMASAFGRGSMITVIARKIS